MDPEGASWGLTEELLASLIEVTDTARLGTTVGFAQKGQKRLKPLHIKRPSDKHRRDQPRRMSPAEAFAYLGAKYVPKEGADA